MTATAGAEHGYEYTGDTSTYVVTMLKRDTRRGTALVKVERLIESDGLGGEIRPGTTITVPLRRVTVRKG